MRLLLIIFPFLIFSFQVSGQTSNSMGSRDIGYEVNKLKHMSSGNSSQVVTGKEIAGNPYLDRNFQKSYILKITGIEVKDIPLRYNLYSNNMEFEKDGKVLTLAVPAEIERINMGGKIFIYARYMTSVDVCAGFFQVLYDGSYQLLKKDRAIIKMPADKTNPDDSLRFVQTEPLYYLRYNNGVAHLVYSQKSLIKTLQPIQQNILSYIKSNKINTQNENKLIDLLYFIDNQPN